MSAAGAHHQKKLRTTAAEEAARKAKQQSKITEYRSLCDSFILKRAHKEWTKETFDLTTKLLSLNPEFYTAWNGRRQYLLSSFSSLSTEEIQSSCLGELALCTASLHEAPKSYWVWHHRKWVLENMPEPPWDGELKLLNKLLDMDARNFHGWDYRRYVVAQSGKRTAQDEFSYTTTKIRQNFSNYSAWHLRSKVLLAAFGDNAEELEAVIKAEFELVRNALFTEPEDQSGWLYHRWLLSLRVDDFARWKGELESIKELLEEEPDAKWALGTAVHILLHLFKHGQCERTMEAEIQRILDRLTALDPDRKMYYRTLMLHPTS
ncbi:hypothetical protein BC832DRAFT_549872 [Gaertneriomyces semiglobifer]|nr:hypothetical protein BC832DRAFT_549872 [Gaertneriomyces semiglobifer]